jgi:histidyl-tRNA synthetase
LSSAIGAERGGPAAERLAAVKGMNDILPADAPYWERVEMAVDALARAYGYRPIRTPIVEFTRLFKRGIGEVTDIVEKEMYSFRDALNGEDLSLRPECTASVVRAVIEHNLLYDGPKRLCYIGPMFRHEKPQLGRSRQFHQFGVEALGFAGPDIDAEVILMGQRLWDDLALSNVRLELNSIGQPEERARHREDLVRYFEANEALLDADARRRLHTNPLRILDTKNPALQELAEGAPKLIDYLGDGSQAHFNELQKLLRESGVSFSVNPRLVRGLDYYNRTVFEWISPGLASQGTICGGGRYDPLMALMGGKPAPACGFAMGLERIVALLKQESALPAQERCDVYVVHQGADASRLALRVAEGLRSGGLDVVLHCSGDGSPSSFKAQLKKADASGAEFAVILGEEEFKMGQASVKALRQGESKGPQERVALDQLSDYLVGALFGDTEFEE